jgi:hypothetical protein
VTWLHNLTKNNTAQSVGQLGVTLVGLQQFQKLLRERWKEIEGFMPSRDVKRDLKMMVQDMNQASKRKGRFSDTSSHVPDNRTRGKVLLELIDNIPELKLILSAWRSFGASQGSS